MDYTDCTVFLIRLRVRFRLPASLINYAGHVAFSYARQDAGREAWV